GVMGESSLDNLDRHGYLCNRLHKSVRVFF
ncbi:Uncharacterised protein, partial [uncultured Comamonas sp.]